MRSLSARICEYWNIGNQISPMIDEATMPMAKTGTRFQVMPRARIVTTVVMRLTDATPVENANVMMHTW